MSMNKDKVFSTYYDERKEVKYELPSFYQKQLSQVKAVDLYQWNAFQLNGSMHKSSYA